MRRRTFITLLGGALSLFLCINALAQEGYYGAGHDKWHQNFYSRLKRNDGQGSCCSLMDCRPTSFVQQLPGGIFSRPPGRRRGVEIDRRVRRIWKSSIGVAVTTGRRRTTTRRRARPPWPSREELRVGPRQTGHASDLCSPRTALPRSCLVAVAHLLSLGMHSSDHVKRRVWT
jgi:hypothetical protein